MNVYISERTINKPTSPLFLSEFHLAFYFCSIFPWLQIYSYPKLSETNSLMENNMGEEMKYNSGQQDLLSSKGMALSLDVPKAPCYSFLVCKIGKILTCLLVKLRSAPVCINAEDY